MLFHRLRLGFVVSIIVTLIALGIFGFVKGKFSGARPGWEAMQTLTIDGLAAAAAYILTRLIS
jgi:VIT1/CCC1 family predicted Fe2+/Mn2+ transporter